MAISVPGIGSNLDVNSIVSQLMALERQPVIKAQQSIRRNETRLSLFGAIQSELASLETAARALSGPNGLAAFSAKLSNPAVLAATASAQAAPGQYAIAVQSVARTQNLVSAPVSDSSAEFGRGFVTLSNALGASFTIEVRGVDANGDTEENAALIGRLTGALEGVVDGLSGGGATSGAPDAGTRTDSASLVSIRDAINGAADNFGVIASIVNDGSGQRLQLMSRDPGVGNRIRVEVFDADDADTDNSGLSRLAFTDSVQNLTETQTASDAVMTVNGLAMTGSSNLFIDAIPGVTLSILAPGDTTLTIGRDGGALADRARKFVEAFNTFVGNSATRYGKGGALEADGSQFLMMTTMSRLIGDGGGAPGNAYRNLFEVGISLRANGRLEFDAAAFEQALATNPAAVASLLSTAETGVMQRVVDTARQFQGAGSVIESRREGIRAANATLNDRIDLLERRMLVIEARLRQQFANLDALLGRLGQTSVALAQQFRV